MNRVSIGKLLEDEELLQRFFIDLKTGSVVIIPTDTLYGFAVDASNHEAVASVYHIKNRSEKKPLILFVDSVKRLIDLGAELSFDQKSLLEKFWPGALTAVITKPEADEICAHSYKTLGVRIPGHSGLIELLKSYSGKLLTTSANRSGLPSVTDPDELFREFFSEVDWLVEDNLKADGTASTVIDLTCSPFRILRQGKVMFEI